MDKLTETQRGHYISGIGQDNKLHDVLRILLEQMAGIQAEAEKMNDYGPSAAEAVASLAKQYTAIENLIRG